MTATYKIESDWGAGFVASVTIKNNGSTPITGWRVNWTWGGNQQISSSWNAGLTSSGRAVTAVNLNYNGTIPPGGSTSFGFQGTYSGTNAAPTLTASAS
ncbi:cellulose-binding domain-containing protein [Dactylosporangium matsuzakiense]|uniref:cellulose-binding domain-containing protein n=1 Tax=Dactylosporangium matsuzakiense TaxID=53360 RepID=UPI0021C43A4D|nr:cellulose-binding domain-containing protein [Dactylosporangium matsuzakiense]